MSRVAIVGVEGSGKTVLMAAIADLYGNPSHDAVYLMPESQSSFAFMKHIPHKMREEHQWPAATTIESFKHLKWSMRIGQRVLMDIEMLDYPGELYRLAFGERKEAEIEPHRESIHEFLAHLVDADILVVLFNLNDALDLGKNARNTETVWLTRGIFEYAMKLPNLKQHLLLFTQADRYSDEFNVPGGAKAVMAKHLPMINMLFPDLECAAVSVATDDAQVPSKDFSATFGISHLMQRLVQFSPDGKVAHEKLLEINHQMEKAPQLDTAHITALYDDLNEIDVPLCELMLPGSVGTLKHQLYARLQQTSISKCQALHRKFEDTQSLADPDALLAESDAIFSKLESCKPANWNMDEPEDLLDQRQFFSEFKEFLNAVETHLYTHSREALTEKLTWQPLCERFAGSPFQTLLANYIALYATDGRQSQPEAGASKATETAKSDPFFWVPVLIAAAAVVLVGVLIFDAAQNRKKEAAKERVRQEQLAAEEKARQAQLAAEEKARQDQLAAEEKARIEKETAAKKAREELERRATEDDPAAQWELGNILSTTINTNHPNYALFIRNPKYWDALIDENNTLAARNWWRRAGELGHLEAQLKMAEVTSGAEQVRWYTLASKQGSHVAASNLGGIFSGENYAEAAEWYVEALRLGGGVEAHFNAAQMYDSASRSNDYKIPEDQKKSFRDNAITHYTKAARLGHLESQKWLNGKGLTW